MDPVIVIGAGPAGLALSLALARYAVPSLVLDATDGSTPPRAARTCVLRPDTLAYLPPLSGLRWRSWRTQRRAQLVEHVDLDPAEAPLHIEQHVLERTLRGALRHEPLSRVVTGSHADVLEQDANGVTAHTRGSSGTWWRGSYAVGCDGARSTVRKLLGVRFPGRTAVERHAVAALRVRLPWEDGEYGPDGAWTPGTEGAALLHRDPGGTPGEVTARPLAAGLWRLDWLLPPRGDLVTPEEMLERIGDTLAVWTEDALRAAARSGAGGGPTDIGPYELVDTGVHTSHQRLARRWRVDRAFLAGDAAHLTGALGVQSVDEGLRDAANLAWKLALAWHHGHDSAADALLDTYEAERRGAVAGRLRAVDQALPLVRRGGGGLRALLPGGGARSHLGLLTDGHLGRGLLGAPAVYARTGLTPARGAVHTVPVGTPPGAPVHDVPVTALDGTRGRLREWLCGGGTGSGLLVVLVAPGTGVWDSRHWLSAGMMPELATAVAGLPLPATLLVTEEYPGAAAHTMLVVRADGHLLAALPGGRPDNLRACAEAARGAALAHAAPRSASAGGRGGGSRGGARAPGGAGGGPGEGSPGGAGPGRGEVSPGGGGPGRGEVSPGGAGPGRGAGLPGGAGAEPPRGEGSPGDAGPGGERGRSVGPGSEYGPGRQLGAGYPRRAVESGGPARRALPGPRGAPGDQHGPHGPHGQREPGDQRAQPEQRTPQKSPEPSGGADPGSPEPGAEASGAPAPEAPGSGVPGPRGTSDEPQPASPRGPADTESSGTPDAEAP